MAPPWRREKKWKKGGIVFLGEFCFLFVALMFLFFSLDLFPATSSLFSPLSLFPLPPPYLRPRHDVEVAGQDVDQLPLALVAPLRAQDGDDLGVGPADGGDSRGGGAGERAASSAGADCRRRLGLHRRIAGGHGPRRGPHASRGDHALSPVRRRYVCKRERGEET